MLPHSPDYTDEEKYLSTNLCNRSRPNRLDIEEFEYVIEVLSKLFLHNISNHNKWRGWGLITQRDKSLHPSHRCQVRFSQNLSSLFKIHRSSVTKHTNHNMMIQSTTPQARSQLPPQSDCSFCHTTIFFGWVE